MRRRNFLRVLGSAGIAWPLAVMAEQSERLRPRRRARGTHRRRLEYQARIGEFQQALALLGWTDGRNVQIDIRWATTNADEIRRHAAELVAFAPDVILAATGTTTVTPLLQATRTVPIVFALVIDPAGAGFVASLARAGRQPHRLSHVRIRPERKMARATQADRPGRYTGGRPSGPDHSLRDRAVRRHRIRGAFAKDGSEPRSVRDAGEIERDLTAFAHSANGGVIVTAGPEGVASS